MAMDTSVAPLPQNTEQTKQGQTSASSSGKTNQISPFYPFLLMTTATLQHCWFTSLFVPRLKTVPFSYRFKGWDPLPSPHEEPRRDLPYRAVHAWLMTSKHTVPDLHENQNNNQNMFDTEKKHCWPTYASSMLGWKILFMNPVERTNRC